MNEPSNSVIITAFFMRDNWLPWPGQRMHAGPYIEISAVCTHPDHHGKGYATALIEQLIKVIRAQEGIPFLHVRADNTRAIALYKALGFLTRHEMTINILRKKA